MNDLTEIIDRTLREHQPSQHARHVAEAVTAAITEHAEAVTDRFEYLDGRQVRRTIIRFPWKDVNDDEH